MPLTQNEWVRQLKLSYVPVRRIENNRPAGSCSGCIIVFGGRRFLLTAAHAVANNGNWAVEVRFDPEVGKTQLRWLGPMTFLAAGNFATGDARRVDFAYAAVPDDLRPLYQDVSPRGQILGQSPRLDITSDLQRQPNAGSRFGFCGQSHVRVVGNWGLSADQPVEVDMIYVRTEGDFHAFRLSHDHPGHGYYYGCSGAPIINNDGSLVAIVSHGDDEQHLIYGTALQKFRVAFVIELLDGDSAGR